MPTLYVFTQYDNDDEIVYRQRGFYRDIHEYLSNVIGGDVDIDTLIGSVRSDKQLVIKCADSRNVFYKIDNYVTADVMYRVLIINTDTDVAILNEVATYDEIHSQFESALTDSFDDFISQVETLPTDKAVNVIVGDRTLEITYYEMEVLH